MKNSMAVVAMVGIAVVIAIGAMAGRSANAATTTIPLGTAATFSVPAGTPSITNDGPTTIDREVGIHPAASVTGFSPSSAAAAATLAPAAGTVAAGPQGLPSTSAVDPFAPLTILGTALAGIGCLLLVRRPVRHL